MTDKIGKDLSQCIQEEQFGRIPSEERAAAEGVQVEADPLPNPLQEAEERRLRGVQEDHSAQEPHHATQEGDEEAARDANHGRHEEDEECDFGSCSNASNEEIGPATSCQSSDC